jgi:hypothetical protein
MGESGGVPPSAEEQRQLEQLELLNGVVGEALRLMPSPSGGSGGGQGQGEGPDPRQVEAVARSVLDLHGLVAPNTPVLDWLTTALASTPVGEQGDLSVAALTVRDLLVAGIDPGPEFEQEDTPAEADAEVRAAEQFASARVEIA